MKQAASRPRPPLPKRGVRLDLAQTVQIDAEFGQRGAHRLQHLQIVERVDQQPADQEFQRQIIDPLAVLVVRGAGRGHPAIDDAVAHAQRGGDEPVPLGGDHRILAHRVGQLGDDGTPQRRDVLILGRQGETAGHAAAWRSVVLVRRASLMRFGSSSGQ